MPFWKCNLFFRSGINGWSETYYTEGTQLSSIEARFSTLASARAEMLATPATMDVGRIVNVNRQRDADMISVRQFPTFDPVYPADTPWQAVYVRLFSSNLYNRPLYIRGIPDAYYNLGSATVGGIIWGNRLDAFLAVVKNGQWLMSVLQKDPAIAPQIDIQSVITTATPGAATVGTVQPHGFVIGDEVQFYTRGATPPLGRKRVSVVVGANFFEVLYDGVLDNPPIKSGSVRKVIPTFAVIESSVLRSVTHRIVGRPFGLSRGARRRTA